MPRLAWLAWLPIAAVVSGCASFTEVPPIPSFAPPRSPLGVRIVAKDESYFQAGRRWIEVIDFGLSKDAANTIRESGWVGVASDIGPAPTLVLKVTQYQGAGPALLVLLTGFVFPGPVDYHIDLKLELVEVDATRYTCARSADTRTWYQTFLILAYPFRSPAYRRMKTTDALALQCLAELLQQHDAPRGSVGDTR
jgi:hypothetical protein